MLSSYRLNVSNEDLQTVTFVPYKQSYFQTRSHHHQQVRRQSCCSVLFPIAFERAATKSFLDPRFDSTILEGQYQSSVFPQIRLRYRYALLYIILSSLIWFCYHLYIVNKEIPRLELITLCVSYIVILSTSAMLFWLTYMRFYRIHTTFVSSLTATILCGTSLILLVFTSFQLFSPLGHFSICIEIILLIYTVIPMRLWQNCLFAVTYSVLFEIGSIQYSIQHAEHTYKILILRSLLHLCVHLVGIHILIMNVVRMRGTFIEVGQNLLVRRQLEMEKQLKEKMIHSVMPPRVADMLLKERSSGDQTVLTPTNDVKSLFRPFHMHSMDNVSILFADIVGFTKMSAKKSAEQLVEILNDLFERFDDLCILNGCEKISTLGDCYYCVSGCPEPRPDHAICCVEMGLGMIQAMRLFDTKRHEGVTMRVGIHTGTVLCGIVGTRRVKFDVWSNDVSLANRMESTGRPGHIHVTQDTFNFLEDKYISENGEEVEGHKTHYIVRRKSSKSYEHLRPNELNLTPPDCIVTTPHDSVITNSIKPLSRSATNLAVSPPMDSISPLVLSSCTSPTITRNRPTTFNKLTRYLRSSVSSSGAASGTNPKDQTNQNQAQSDPAEPPQIFISTKSLPDSLTSGNPSILNCCPNSLTPTNRQTIVEPNGALPDNQKTDLLIPNVAYDLNETVTSTKSTSSKWKLPKYLRKFDSKNNNNSAKCDSVKCVITDGTINGTSTTDNSQSYQLLPIIIQKTSTETSLYAVDKQNPGNYYDRENNGNGSTPSCSPSPRSIVNVISLDIIDVRSYISQSRSDITPFNQERSDSCKFRSPRSFYGDISPMRRPRASTLALTSQEHLTNKVNIGETGNELKVPNALTSFSRKNSDHYSPNIHQLQLPGEAANKTSISQERLSTGDISSWVSNISDDPISMEHSSTIAIPSSTDKHLDSARKQSDLQLIRCVRDNARSQQSYLVQPPLSKLSLFFMSPLMEQEFRAKAHQFNTRCGPITIATPVYNTYIDIFIGIVSYSTVSMAMFLLSASHQFNDTLLKWLWFGLFGLFSVIEIFALILFTKKLFRRPHYKKTPAMPQSSSFATSIPPDSAQALAQQQRLTDQAETTAKYGSSSSASVNSTPASSCEANNFLEDKIIGTISTWYKWHFCLGFLMSLPVILTLVHYFIKNLTHEVAIFEYHYGFLMLVCIVHFCNFTQLNCWMRNILAILAALAFVVGMSIYQINWNSSYNVHLNGTNVNNETFFKHSDLISNLIPLVVSDNLLYSNINSAYNQSFPKSILDEDKHENLTNRFYFDPKINLEIYLDLILLLILVWFLNREFEIFYRFAFYGSAIAEKDKIRVQTMKNQADLLLQNIIPKHVADHLKNTAKYSENHYNVAIIFASLINFNELYDESYLGGREYLRVLNELIGDFDELLSRKEFLCVEKIKTIGSTFMAASGLDNYYRDNLSNNHINALMEFALAMQEVVAAFNKDLLEFDLILRIGFNVGDVTAGVIGTSKLHYDIWGDAVNVSSRMDSTGIPGRIQVGKDCIPFLNEQLYEFEPRGKVFVKGKDNMEVYLVKRKRLET